MNVLVTGGTGSLGRALIAALLADPTVERVCSLSRDEVKAGELSARHAADEARLRVFLGDVRDVDRLQQAFYGVDTVVHAAALKRVTESVYSPGELIRTNIQGTINVIQAASYAGVRRVLFVSSDKAVSPLNLYGMTKAVAECYAVQANSYTYAQGTAVSCVRYGNVIGSRGAVLPHWIAEARAGRPLTLTSPDMSRFVVTIEDAAQFVRAALDVMGGGEIFLPSLPAIRMGEAAVVVADLVAKDMGTKPVKIVVAGLRPGGEKLAEELLSPDEIARTFTIVKGLGPFVPAFLVAPSYQTWCRATWDRETLTPFPALWTYKSDAVPLLTGQSLRDLVRHLMKGLP